MILVGTSYQYGDGNGNIGQTYARVLAIHDSSLVAICDPSQPKDRPKMDSQNVEFIEALVC